MSLSLEKEQAKMFQRLPGTGALNPSDRDLAQNVPLFSRFSEKSDLNKVVVEKDRYNIMRWAW